MPLETTNTKLSNEKQLLRDSQTITFIFFFLKITWNAHPYIVVFFFNYYRLKLGEIATATSSFRFVFIAGYEFVDLNINSVSREKCQGRMHLLGLVITETFIWRDGVCLFRETTNFFFAFMLFLMIFWKYIHSVIIITQSVFLYICCGHI